MHVVEHPNAALMHVVEHPNAALTRVFKTPQRYVTGRQEVTILVRYQQGFGRPEMALVKTSEHARRS